jgi:uncharacterized protein YacL
VQPIWIVRVLFVLTLTLCGYWVGKSGSARGLEFSAVALLLSLFIVALEYATRILSAKKIVLGTLGAFAGLAFSALFRDTFPAYMLGGQEAVTAACNLLFMYFGIVMALRNADRISLSRLRFFITSPKEDSVLLDTSVIIDGRIKDLFQMGFLAKTALLPSFVLDELQTLADSKDSSKRHSGRKGLENLETFRDAINFQLLEKDYPEVKDVDHKLIALAKELGATILTNDFNLAKVAGLHQVRALNVNSLAAALRPNLSVGDQLLIAITREGKDPGQGVGYLEDGTMVVVDNAKKMIGATVPVSIISMMQTNAGRLAFARLFEGGIDSSAKIEIVKAE